MDNSREIMTLTEVASYLQIAEKTVLRMIGKNQIPSAKVGNQWRFMRSMIDDWLLSRMQTVPADGLSRLIESGEEPVPLSRLIPDYGLLTEIRPGDKTAVMEQLVQPLVEHGGLIRPGEFIGKLLDREGMTSTAVGSGIAIPHIRRPKENQIDGPLLIVGICPEGTDFDSIDRKPTHAFFLVITSSEVVHLRIIAMISRISRDKTLIPDLIRARNPEEMLSELIKREYPAGKE